MKKIIRLLGICVALLGIASLVFGIIFVVMSSSAEAEVFDSLVDEGWPMIKYDENMYPYLGLTDAALTGDIIDTAEDLEAVRDVLSDARQQMTVGAEGAALFGTLFVPSTIPAAELNPEGAVDVDTLVFHEYAGLLGFSGVLGISETALGTASLIQFVGIVTIILGVALMLTGFVIFRLAPAHE